MGKLTYQEVKDFIEGSEGNGCRLLSTEYVNNRSKLQIQCACGEIFEVCFDSFKSKRRHQNQCPKCGIERRAKKRRHTYDEIKDYVESVGCKLLSNEYVNNKTKLQIQCACGEIFWERFDTFKKSGRSKCSKCNGITKWNYEMVKSFIEGREGNGCKLLSTEYKDISTKLQIQCACGEIFYVSLNQFKGQNKRQCNKCGIKLKSGENHPRYNPNLTDIDREDNRATEEYIEWRKAVYERDYYQCRCCGDNKGGNLNAHHLNGYNLDKEHRTDELNGITLCEKCHKELHSIYGYGNNTIEQFREFLYNKYLQTKDLKYLATLEDIDIRKYVMLTNNLSLPI